MEGKIIKDFGFTYMYYGCGMFNCLFNKTLYRIKLILFHVLNLQSQFLISSKWFNVNEKTGHLLDSINN